MRSWRGLPVVLIVLVCAPGAHACSGAYAKPTAGNAPKVAKATVCLINRRRAKAGLKRLKAHKELRAAAAAHSQDMVARQYFEHDGPAGDTLVSRVQGTGYLESVHSWAVAENIAYGTGRRGTAAAIVKSWMGSATHRANILNKRFRDAGVGLAAGTPDGERGATFTLDFGFAR